MFNDLRGLSHTVSSLGYHFYVTFVNACSRFTFIYLLKNKYDTLNIGIARRMDSSCVLGGIGINCLCIPSLSLFLSLSKNAQKTREELGLKEFKEIEIRSFVLGVNFVITRRSIEQLIRSKDKINVSERYK